MRRVTLNLADGSREQYDVDLAADFAVDENNLEQAMSGLPQLSTFYTRIAACLESEYDYFKEYVQNLKARVMRAAKDTQRSGAKLTDETVKAALLEDEEYQTAQRMLWDLDTRRREARGWCKSVDYKMEMVRSLNSRQNQEARNY